MACLYDGGDKLFISIMMEFIDQMNIPYRYIPLLVIIHGINTIEMTRQLEYFCNIRSFRCREHQWAWADVMRVRTLHAWSCAYVISVLPQSGRCRCQHQIPPAFCQMYWKTLKDHIQEVVTDFLQFMHTEADKLICYPRHWGVQMCYIPKESL